MITKETHLYHYMYGSVVIYGDHTCVYIGYKSKKERCPNCGSRIWENRIGTQWCGNFIDGFIHEDTNQIINNKYCGWKSKRYFNKNKRRK